MKTTFKQKVAKKLIEFTLRKFFLKDKSFEKLTIKRINKEAVELELDIKNRDTYMVICEEKDYTDFFGKKVDWDLVKCNTKALLELNIAEMELYNEARNKIELKSTFISHHKSMLEWYELKP